MLNNNVKYLHTDINQFIMVAFSLSLAARIIVN